MEQYGQLVQSFVVLLPLHSAAGSANLFWNLQLLNRSIHILQDLF